VSVAAIVASGFPAQNLSFRFRDGDRIVVCTITREVLQDLGSHHGLSFTDEEVRNVLLPELDRLASLKYAAGRLEENGELVIRTADLLRYGFQRAA
jgi:hypothetical protein